MQVHTVCMCELQHASTQCVCVNYNMQVHTVCMCVCVYVFVINQLKCLTLQVPRSPDAITESDAVVLEHADVPKVFPLWMNQNSTAVHTRCIHQCVRVCVCT